jgi:hypothetical protein
MQYFLYAKFTLKAFQFVNFVDAAESLNGALAEAGWNLVAACSAVTGAAFPGTIIHVWESDGLGASLTQAGQPHSPHLQELLKYCELSKHAILESTTYSKLETRLLRPKKKRIHYFLAADIELLDGEFAAFNKAAATLVGKVKGLGWTLVVARFAKPSSVFHLWELSSADIVLNAMRSFGDTKLYAELLGCCEKHTQQLFTAMPYNPSGGNPSDSTS